MYNVWRCLLVVLVPVSWPLSLTVVTVWHTYNCKMQYVPRCVYMVSSWAWVGIDSMPCSTYKNSSELQVSLWWKDIWTDVYTKMYNYFKSLGRSTKKKKKILKVLCSLKSNSIIWEINFILIHRYKILIFQEMSDLILSYMGYLSI